MKDVVIIGAGLFGCIIAKQLKEKGLDVVIVDNAEDRAGSRPAACLMKPSWYSSMGREQYIPAMETLESLYEVKTIEFHTKVAKTKVKWIDPKIILLPNSIFAKVEKIFRSEMTNFWTIHTNTGHFDTKRIIVAAGIWCNDILHQAGLGKVPHLSPMTGTAFTVEGKVEKPLILLWRPYKQAVFWEMYPGKIWIGDGETAKDYQEHHLIKSQHRCADFLQIPPAELRPITGHRPYVKDIKPKPCYLEQHAPNLWVVTGGAKNGTIAAGWAANELGKVLGS